ncbi:MAG: dihydrolipoyl dehydrogenase [Bacillota bacterium]
MENLTKDLLIIGAGPGGYVGAIYAKRKGIDVVLVEKESIGGTCLNWGCIPTKALVRSAKFYNEVLNSEALGIKLEKPQVDLKKIIDKKDNIVKDLVKGIEYLLEKHKVKVIKGQASFKNDKEVIVKGDKDYLIEAKRIIIATGSKPKHLPITGIDLAINSKEILANKTLPKSLTIIGGGIIGMEFAFIYANLGVKVNIVEFLPRILPGIDKELAMRLIPYAKKAGINVVTNARVTKIKAENKQKVVIYERKGKENKITSELVLEAVGRAPNTNNLGLENTGIEFSEKFGIKVNECLKTTVDHIYAIGDVNNLIQLAHAASHQAFITVDNILGKKKTFSIKNIPSVIFTNPTIAIVGITEEMAKEKALDYQVIKVPYSANGKALILDAKKGYIKLIKANKTNKLIGAMILGEEAENLIATYTLAINNGFIPEDVYETVFAHPTIQELVHESALGLDNLAIHFLE